MRKPTRQRPVIAISTFFPTDDVKYECRRIGGESEVSGASVGELRYGDFLTAMVVLPVGKASANQSCLANASRIDDRLDSVRLFALRVGNVKERNGEGPRCYSFSPVITMPRTK